jgi:hypothetical protein
MLLIGCSLVVIVTFFVVLCATIMVHSIRKEHSPVPSFLLIVGTFLTFLTPLPSAPDTPEKLHFLQYRAEYEDVVALAKSDTLQSSPACRPQYSLTEALRRVSSVDCIDIMQDHDRGLVIFFYPFEKLFRLTYVEFDHIEFPCGRELWVEQNIEAHWYVCQLDERQFD